MRFPSKEVVERIRREFPAGTRVELVRMDDRRYEAPSVDDTVPSHALGQGSGLNVVYGEDIVRKVGDRRANNILKDFVSGNIIRMTSS